MNDFFLSALFLAQFVYDMPKSVTSDKRKRSSHYFWAFYDSQRKLQVNESVRNLALHPGPSVPQVRKGSGKLV